MKKIILIATAFCSISAVHAQVEETEEIEYSVLSSDSAYIDIGLIPEVLDENVNNLLQSWHVQYFSKTENHCLDDDSNVQFPDEIYRQRLSRLPCIIPMNYNPLVRRCIDLYADRRRDLVRYMMGMADFYFPIFEQILDEYDLPLELKYLAVVESMLNPRALSRVGAAGIWQFMLPTGKIYGLEINSLIDERLDPYKSTHAACKYFKEMYAVYGDWHLVLASYNCGPGNVNRAIRRAGGKTNFWDIFPYLPRETRSYVPLFIAATYIMNYYCEHNLCPLQTSLSLAVDTIVVNRMLHLSQVAEVLNIDIELVRLLNPQYKREIIPGHIVPSVLKLPVAATYDFIDKEDSVYLHRIEELLATSRPARTSSSAAGKTVAESSSTRETIKHTVEAGENLHIIANRYGVTARDIRKWNRLSSNRVSRGRQLTIYVDNGGVRYTAKKDTGAPPPAADASASRVSGPKQAAAPTTITANTPPQQQPSQAVNTLRSGAKIISYKVRSGDSLYTISKKYPGVTVAKIQQANQMSTTKIKPGQILKIPVG
jgi:membrane-bound lytic murein transglycosylase D